MKRVLQFHPNQKWTLQLPWSSHFKVAKIEGALRSIITKCTTNPSQALKHPWIADAPAPVKVTTHSDGDDGNNNFSKENALPSLPGI